MTREEYLAEVHRIIRDNFRPDDSSGGMTAASAAYLIRRLVGHSQTDFGFLKFKDVLEELARQGKIRTGPNSKDAYSIWIAGEDAAGVAKKAPPAPRSFRPLRKPIWFAFIGEEPKSARWFERTTGEIRFESTVPSESGEWVEIAPISNEHQRERATEFLRAHEVDDREMAEAINTEKWYVEFPRLLASKQPHLAAQWKRQRSAEIIRQVQGWCSNNGVSEDLIFESPHPQQRMAPSSLLQPSEASDSLRQALLNAISRMPTEELMRLHLPVSHVVAVLRPDLVR